MTGTPRILHAPSDVAGNAWGLSRAERELGLVSDVAVLSGGRYGFGADLDLSAGPDQPLWHQLRRRAGFLRYALDHYDIFHFNFGQTLLTVMRRGRVLNELALLRRTGKTILVTFQGCDVRPKSACFCRDPGCAANDRYRAANATSIARHAHRIFYLNPDLRHYLPGARFIPYASVDSRTLTPARPRGGGAGDEMVVAHAPTDRDVKGTRHVIAAVEQLRGEGVPVRLDLVEGVAHDQALARVRGADIVVDQLLLGWYGGLAVESMAMAKPVLCFIREDEAADNPFGDELPIVRTSPTTLPEDLRALVSEPERRRAQGAAGRSFAERHHDPRRIARAVLDGLLEG